MSSVTLRLICNALGILGAAMFAGVMLAIGVTLGGYWKSLPPDGFLDWFSQNNHFIMNSKRNSISDSEQFRRGKTAGKGVFPKQYIGYTLPSVPCSQRLDLSAT